MADTLAEDAHSGWDGVMKFKAGKAERALHARSPPDNIAASLGQTSNLNEWDNYDRENMDCWQWSSSGRSSRSSSISLSSAAGSLSTATSLSMSAVCRDEDNIEDNIAFESSDDIGYYEVPNSVEAHPDYSASPAESPEWPQFLEPVGFPEDDTALCTQPSQHVDYLSHNWAEEDIWASWSHIKSKRSGYTNGARLENASWRTWQKIRCNLKTVSPKTLNWPKDRDVTWLYGPLSVGPSLPLDSTQTSTVQPKATGGSSKLILASKPILKKRNMSEIMLQRSLSSSSLLKQAAAAAQAQQSEYNKPKSVRFSCSSRRRSVSSISSSGLVSPPEASKKKKKKHIHFNEQVEQCIAIDAKGDDEDEPEKYASHNCSDSDWDDGGFLMTRRNSKRKLPALHRERLTRRASLGAESKTIAMLPSTTLKYGEDASDIPEISMKLSNGFWNASKFCSSPSQEAPRPVNRSLRMLPGDDEGEDEDGLDPQPPSVFTKCKDLRKAHERQRSGDSSNDSNDSTCERPIQSVSDPVDLAKAAAALNTTRTNITEIKIASNNSSETSKPLEVSQDVESESSSKLPEPHHFGTLSKLLSSVVNKTRIKIDRNGLRIHWEGDRPEAEVELTSSRLSNQHTHRLGNPKFGPQTTKRIAHQTSEVLDMSYPIADLLKYRLAPSAPSGSFENMQSKALNSGKQHSLPASFQVQAASEVPSLFQEDETVDSKDSTSDQVIHIADERNYSASLIISTGGRLPSACIPASDALLELDECITDEDAGLNIKQSLEPIVNGALLGSELGIHWKVDCLNKTEEVDEDPSDSNTPARAFSSDGQSNDDMDEDEAMNDYSSSESDTGSSQSPYHDIFTAADHEFDSRQGLIAPVLDSMRQALVDRVMEEFWVVFNPSWEIWVKECGSGSSDSSNGQASSISPDVASLQPGQRKRQRGDEEPEDNNRNDPRKPRRPLGPNSGPDSANRFACPFRKHDARRYSMQSHRVCALSHWETIARVKEHLYRCHQMAPHCKRCWKTFKTHGQLDAHITVAAADICEVQSGYPPEGITPEHEKKLRSRKKTSPNQSDEDRWKDIYRLLFPNEEVPSPYYEPVQEEVPMSPDSRDLAGYEDYIRRELPRLVRSNIEEVARRDMQPLEASLIGSLVEIIQDCQDRVFRAYREAQGLDNDIETPSNEDSAGAISSISLDPSEDGVPEQSPESYPRRSEFLDNVFEPPRALVRETTLPTFERNESLSSFEPSTSSDMMFSDSGYASEQLQSCDCQGPCNCIGRIQDQGQALRGIDISVRDEMGLEDMQWNDLNSTQSWSQMNSMTSDFEWWNGG